MGAIEMKRMQHCIPSLSVRLNNWPRLRLIDLVSTIGLSFFQQHERHLFSEYKNAKDTDIVRQWEGKKTQKKVPILRFSGAFQGFGGDRCPPNRKSDFFLLLYPAVTLLQNWEE
jgi:hypothetical protein